VETVHRTYHPACVPAFAEDVGQGRGPVDGKPAAYVCRDQISPTLPHAHRHFAGKIHLHVISLHHTTTGAANR
jgi:hypothetical protein